VAVEPRGLLCLIGPSAGGKTTLLRLGAGSLKPDSGNVWAGGNPIRPGRSGILGPEEEVHPRLSVVSAINRRMRQAGVGNRFVERRLKATLRSFGLEAVRDERIGSLSSTLRQRAILATQWACPGSVWLLDDPSAHLDVEFRDLWPGLLRDWQSRESAAVVMATTDLQEAMKADRVAILHEGRVVAADAPAKLCRKAAPEQIVVRTVDDARALQTLSANLHLEAERLPDGLRLRVRKADDVLAGVLQQLGGELETVWVRKPSLRDAINYYISLPRPPEEPKHPPR
jgi:ABC-2 type transport system ATP-binding protein